MQFGHWIVLLLTLPSSVVKALCGAGSTQGSQDKAMDVQQWATPVCIYLLL